MKLTMGNVLDELWAAGWDGLDVRHDWRTGACAYELSRSLSGDVDWTRYGRDFNAHTLLHPAPAVSVSPAPEQIAALGPACAQLAETAMQIMRRGRHELVSLRAASQLGIGVMLCQHSSLPGSANGLHAITAGGIRRHALADVPADVVLDGLNLGRAMTYKNVAAALPAGGSKLILCADELGHDDAARLGFVAWAIDRARTMTGPDMGLTPRHADALIERFTRNITGGEHGIPTGPPTAYGVVLAIETVLGHMDGVVSWSSTTVAVQGLGSVGATLARSVIERGGRVLVADAAAERVDEFVALHPEAVAVGVDEILAAECDVLAPAAIGGVLTEAAIQRLRCRAVIGAANNMLAADSLGEERRLARLLEGRGIVFVIEWHLNVGGVLAGWEQWRAEGEPDLERVHRATEPRCTGAIAELLREASRRGVTPTELSYALVDEALGYPLEPVAA